MDTFASLWVTSRTLNICMYVVKFYFYSSLSISSSICKNRITLLLAASIVSSFEQEARQAGRLVNWLNDKQISRRWTRLPGNIIEAYIYKYTEEQVSMV